MSGDFEYAIKKDVRNNPIVREVDEARQRQLCMWRNAPAVTGPMCPEDAQQRCSIRRCSRVSATIGSYASSEPDCPRPACRHSTT